MGFNYTVEVRRSRDECRLRRTILRPAAANQNSIKSFAISTSPEKCFLTSSAHAV